MEHLQNTYDVWPNPKIQCQELGRQKQAFPDEGTPGGKNAVYISGRGRFDGPAPDTEFQDFATYEALHQLMS